MLELPKVVSAASPPAGKHQSVTSSRAAALAGPELSALHALLNQGVSASLRAREAAEKYFYQSASACQATDNDDGIPNAVQEEIKRHHRQTSSSSALSSASSADRAWTSREAAHKSAQHRRICVLYPKILDEELLTHNKHRSGKMKGVLPGPRESLHGDKLRGFCDDVLRDSAAQVKHLSLTSTEAIPVVKRTKADVTKADFLERSSKGSGVMAPPPDTLTLYTSSCACITELIIAGALALSEHLSPTQCPTESPGTPGRLPGEFLRDNADVPVGAGWEEGGWQELAYEACKRAQQLCLLLYPRLERLGLMGGAMSATLDKFQAAAANNLGCIYVSGSKPHAALYYLEQALKYQDAASALAQLSQHDAAIAHCRCALAGLHNMINNNNNSDQSSEAIEKGAAQHSQARSKGARLKAHKARCALAAAQDRMGLGLILLASLHEAAGNLHEAAAAWERSAALRDVQDSLDQRRQALHADARRLRTPPPLSLPATAATRPFTTQTLAQQQHPITPAGAEEDTVSGTGRLGEGKDLNMLGLALRRKAVVADTSSRTIAAAVTDEDGYRADSAQRTRRVRFLKEASATEGEVAAGGVTGRDLGGVKGGEELEQTMVTTGRLLVSVGASTRVQSALVKSGTSGGDVGEGAGVIEEGQDVGVYRGGQEADVAKEVLRLLEDSVPVLVDQVRPQHTLDDQILEHIFNTVPRIVHEEDIPPKEPKEFDVLAMLQDDAGFDVRSWRGVLARNTSFDRLVDLLRHHLVLRLDFPLRVLCVTTEGDELIIDSDRTLEASILHTLHLTSHMGHTQMVLAVRRARTPLFSTSTREAAALRLQGNVRVHQARTKRRKKQARMFEKSLYLGRYQVDGLPSLCQHRQLVALLCRAHNLTQPHALAQLERKLLAVRAKSGRRSPQLLASDLRQVDALSRRVLPSAPHLACNALKDWMASDSCMPLHALSDADPLVLSPAADRAEDALGRDMCAEVVADEVSDGAGGDERGAIAAGDYSTNFSRQQSQVVMQSGRLNKLAAGGAKGTTEAQRMREVMSTLQSWSSGSQPDAMTQNSHIREVVQVTAGGDQTGVQTEGCVDTESLQAPSRGSDQYFNKSVPLDDNIQSSAVSGEHDAEEEGDLRRLGSSASVRSAMTPDTAASAGRASTPALLKGAWDGRSMEAFDERAISHLSVLTATDCLAEHESRRILLSLEEDAGSAGGNAALEKGAGNEVMDGGSRLRRGVSKLNNVLKFRTHGDDSDDVSNLAPLAQDVENRALGISSSVDSLHQATWLRVLIRFTHARDMIHDRHVQLLRRCEGPFVVPVLDTVDTKPEDSGPGPSASADVWTRLAGRKPAPGEAQRLIANVTREACEHLAESPAVRKRRKRALRPDRAVHGGPGAEPGDDGASVARGRQRSGSDSGMDARESPPGRPRAAAGQTVQAEARCAIVTPLPVTTLREELQRRHETRHATVEPLLSWFAGLLTFLHMKRVCLVELDLDQLVQLSDGTWRVQDLSYSRLFGSRLATQDSYLRAQLQERSMVPEVMEAARAGELDPDNPARSPLVAGEPVDVFNLGLLLHYAVTGREYFADLAQAAQEVVHKKTPLQPLQAFSGHPVMTLLFGLGGKKGVLVRSPQQRVGVRECMSEFSRLMQVQRVRERQLEDERFGAGDTSRETLARTLKTALSEMPRKLREGVLQNPRTGLQ